MMRMRIGCFQLSSQKACYGAIPAQYKTTCCFCGGEGRETLLHYLWECSRFMEVRQEAYREVVVDCNTDIALLFRTGVTNPQDRATCIAVLLGRGRDATGPVQIKMVLATASFLTKTIPVRARVLQALVTLV